MCVGGGLLIVTLLLLYFTNDENRKQKNTRCEACSCTALPLKKSREPKMFPWHFSRERLVILVGHLVFGNPAVHVTMKREEYGRCLDPQREKFWKPCHFRLSKQWQWWRTTHAHCSQRIQLSGLGFVSRLRANEHHFHMWTQSTFENPKEKPFSLVANVVM